MTARGAALAAPLALLLAGDSKSSVGNIWTSDGRECALPALSSSQTGAPSPRSDRCVPAANAAVATTVKSRRPAGRPTFGPEADGMSGFGVVYQKEISMHQQYASCIEACNACADACDHCASACLQEQDVKMMARCIALDIDCAAICRLAAGYMARGSEFANQICRLCADVCQTCGDECAKHEHDHCQQCAEACLRCAEECRKMAA